LALAQFGAFVVFSAVVVDFGVVVLVEILVLLVEVVEIPVVPVDPVDPVDAVDPVDPVVPVGVTVVVFVVVEVAVVVRVEVVVEVAVEVGVVVVVVDGEFDVEVTVVPLCVVVPDKSVQVLYNESFILNYLKLENNFTLANFCREPAQKGSDSGIA